LRKTALNWTSCGQPLSKLRRSDLLQGALEKNESFFGVYLAPWTVLRPPHEAALVKRLVAVGGLHKVL
jgi:hypothetical protein